jgi:hypothetical protein
MRFSTLKGMGEEPIKTDVVSASTIAHFLLSALELGWLGM